MVTYLVEYTFYFVKHLQHITNGLHIEVLRSALLMRFSACKDITENIRMQSPALDLIEFAISDVQTTLQK